MSNKENIPNKSVENDEFSTIIKYNNNNHKKRSLQNQCSHENPTKKRRLSKQIHNNIKYAYNPLYRYFIM